jgi:hypothetical protein
MKKTILTLFIALFTIGFAIGQEMYLTEYITPKKGLEDIFQKNLMDHIKKFHSEAPYQAHARYVMFGQHEMQYVWVSGPTTYAEMDNMSRPDSTAHSADWAVNVEPLIEETCTNELWKRKDDLSYVPADGSDGLKLQLIRFYSLKPGKWNPFMDLMKKIANVWKTNNYKESWSIYVNSFDAGKGRNIAAINGFPNWAFLQSDTWIADYEKIYGKDSWKAAMATFDECIDKYQEEVRKVL